MIIIKFLALLVIDIVIKLGDFQKQIYRESLPERLMSLSNYVEGNHKYCLRQAQATV